MKIGTLMMILAIAGIRTSFAQQTITNTPVPHQNKTDFIFNTPLPGTSNIKFEFLLRVGNKMILEFNSLAQLDSLPDIDSLLNEIQRNLQNFSDSLDLPLVNRRIDYYHISEVETRIRIQQYPQKGEIFSLRNNDVTQLKIEQDTLRIRLFTRAAGKIGGEDRIFSFPYFITFILNNINDIQSVATDRKIEVALTLLKKDLAKEKSSKSSKQPFTRYYALYDAVNEKRISPLARDVRGYGRKTNVLPYVQTGIQYIRGEWAPSAGVGIELKRSIFQNQQMHIRLMWEPYFFFSRNTAGKLVAGRNDFITFKYNYTSKFNTPSREIQFVQNISLSYLVARQGDWFEPVTFKFSLPGLQTKNVLLEPEFVFNKLLKNFSPSLKLTLFFE